MASKVPAKKSPTVPEQGTTSTLARWEPIDLLNSFQDEMERFFRPFGLSRPLLREPLRGMQLPRTDIYEQDGQLVISAELPGMKKEEIGITLEGDDLVIQAEHKSEEETKEKDYYRMERRSGSFYRRVPLSFEVKPEQITAKYDNGVLEVRIPEPTEQSTQKHQIAVQ